MNKKVLIDGLLVHSFRRFYFVKSNQRVKNGQTPFGYDL